MNAGFLLIPLILIRYALLAIISSEALGRAAHFAPLVGREKAAYWVYQATSLGIIVLLFFLNVNAKSLLFYIGLGVYVIGAALCTISVVCYARPKANGINTEGLYRFSRDPMYMAYFLYFLGCAAMTQSLLLLAIVIINQISTHFIIISEERWCIEKFGDQYRDYMRRVRRYI